MFVAEKLIYLELQKTGGSHLRKLLSEYTDGNREGKHNLLEPKYSDRFIIGSIRNPWDWYVSLWAYGVGGQGGLRSRCVTGIDFHYYNTMLPKDMGKDWLTPGQLITSLYHDAIKPVRQWQQAYEHANNPVLFQAWIKLLLGKKRRYDIGEGYGFSPLSECAGLLTYRYLRLFTSTMFNVHIYKDQRLRTFDGIGDYDREFNITDGMIRTENLENDFVRLLNEAGYLLSDEQLQAIQNKESGKTNISKRKSAGYYYNDETIALVGDRDRYLIEKHDYEPPVMV